MTRTDLLALTPDLLAALSSRGLVKRALKDLDAGSGPTVETAADGTVRGRYPDGTESELPPGQGLESAVCSCAATGVCRHRVGLVLAYTREAEGGDPRPRRFTDWSPGAFDDAALETALGRPVPAAARQARERGYVAVVHRARPESPTPAVELPACTVRFPVPHEVGLALTDAVPELRDEVVALAVWAFREADARGTDRLTVGGPSPQGHPATPDRPTAPDRSTPTDSSTAPDSSTVPDRPTATGGPTPPGRSTAPDSPVPPHRSTALDRLSPDSPYAPESPIPQDRPTAPDTLTPPDSHTARVDPAPREEPPAPPRTTGRRAAGDPAPGGPPAEDRSYRVRVAALDLVDDLLLDGVPAAGPVLDGTLRRAQEDLTRDGQHWPAAVVAAIRDQLTAYADRAARHDADAYALLLAELHARHRAAATDPAGVLGTGEAARTPLRLVRLTALGCRVGGSHGERTAAIHLAHPSAGVVLTLRRRWDADEDGPPLTGERLGARRLLGTTLRTLAASNVVSENTTRTAGRAVEISRGRVAAATVTPVGSAWQDLPPGLRIDDLAAQLPAPEELPPSLVRPRVEAESVRVLTVGEVGPVRYDPARQRLEAVLQDPAGHEALLSAHHNPYCPGALDALAVALRSGQVLQVSGFLRHEAGGIVVDPLAVRTAEGVLVPDLAPGDGDGALPVAPAPPQDPLTAAADEALAALAQAAHRGLRHLAGAVRADLDRACDGLRRVGLRAAADALVGLPAALRARGPAAAVPAWTDATIRLAVTRELHRRSGNAG
ncbi:hypothetical protein [Streptomyces sp. NPDC005012]|uniref:hypothetical protein n=1 Tax=Streptomyces sp. NPDC005012 TaxID=3154558 RepID=UPI0033B713F0